MHASSCMNYDRLLQRTDLSLKMRMSCTGRVARIFSGVANLEVDGVFAL